MICEQCNRDMEMNKINEDITKYLCDCGFWVKKKRIYGLPAHLNDKYDFEKKQINYSGSQV